jgi:RNA polymerase sigma-70 factor (ECF subfamily)
VERHSGFVELYEKAFPAVYRAAFLLSGDGDLAEEATQEAFARALERWGRISGEPWTMGWVMTTALNIVRRARWVRGDALLPARERMEDERENSIDLWRAIRSLSPRQQEAVTLHYIADLPLHQVAKVMGCENGTAKAHLWRARQQLARHLGVEGDA